MSKIVITLTFLISLLLISCGDEDKSVCDDVTCSNHGECAVDGDKAICVCDTGYNAKGLKCEKSTEFEFTDEVLATMCNAEIACGLYTPPDNINECVRYAYDFINADQNSTFGKEQGIYINNMRKSIKCMYEAKNCSEYAACESMELTTKSCDYETYTNSCTGNKTTVCNRYGKIVKEDCSKNGYVCVSEDGDAWCDIPDGTECSDMEYKGKCNGNMLTYCSYGNIVTRSCDVVSGDNSTCDPDSTGEGFCTPKNIVSCDFDKYKQKCEGDYMLTCDINRVAKIDCKKLWGDDYTCYMINYGGTKYAECINRRSSKECPHEPTCNGNVLSYCVDGKIKTYNCVDNGYKSCVAKSSNNPASCRF